MKRLTYALFLLSLFATAEAQTKTGGTMVTPVAPKLPELDKSPMDMSYFPADYPVLKSQHKATAAPLARIIYGRPQKEDRLVFGGLVAYNEVWRLGANESTEIEFFKDATIAGKKIAKGRYTLYAIPNETKWTLIINRDTDVWGAFVYDEKKDVLRAEVDVTTLNKAVEPLSMVFVKSDKGANLVIAWEKTTVSLPIEFK
jgi:hypothetical protein